MPNPFPISQKNALRTLLDDPSPTVRKAILETLHSHGKEGLKFLREEIHSNNPAYIKRCQELLCELESDCPASMFMNFIDSLQYELESGFFLLSRVDKPELDVCAIITELNSIAQRCKTLFSHPMSERDHCRIINRVLFHEYGFTGNRFDFENPANSFIHSLLKTRKGIPISLSILYLLIARRCDLELEPIALPGRFMVGSFSESEPFFIDVYENGLFRSVDNVLDFLQQNKLEANLAHFAPCPEGEVLCRCCRNLVHQYTLSGQKEKADLYQQFVHEFESLEQETSH